VLWFFGTLQRWLQLLNLFFVSLRFDLLCRVQPSPTPLGMQHVMPGASPPRNLPPMASPELSPAVAMAASPELSGSSVGGGGGVGMRESAMATASVLIDGVQLGAVCLLPAACCLLPAACCLLPAACCLLPAACCLLPLPPTRNTHTHDERTPHTDE
jgi:hypothetical protein